MYTYEKEHDPKRPLFTFPVPTPTELFEAQGVVSSKQELARILSSKLITEVQLAVGNLVEKYVSTDREKRGE